MKDRLVIVSLLLLIWLGFSNNFGWPNILLGSFFSLLIHYLVIPSRMNIRVNLLKSISLIVYVVWELLISSVQVAADILRPNRKNQSQLLTIPLTCRHPAQISLLSTLISLTPGTLAIDVIEKDHTLLVHTMFGQKRSEIEAFIKNTLEVKIMQVIHYE